MYVERVPNRSSPPAVLLRESYREGGRIKKRTLANLSKLPYEAVEAVRRVLRGEPLVNPQEAFTCVRSLPHGHVAAVLGTLEQLGLHTLLARQPSRWRELAVLSRRPRHRPAVEVWRTARALAPESWTVSTLGEMRSAWRDGRPASELYAGRWTGVVERQATIEQRLAKRHLERPARWCSTHRQGVLQLSGRQTRCPLRPRAATAATARRAAPADRLRTCCARPRAVRWRSRYSQCSTADPNTP